DKDIADDFMTQLVDGIGLEAGSAILALRERAIRNQADRRRDSHRSQLGLLITVWNAHWSGRTMQRMQLPKGGAFTEANFPKMIGWHGSVSRGAENWSGGGPGAGARYADVTGR